MCNFQQAIRFRVTPFFKNIINTQSHYNKYDNGRTMIGVRSLYDRCTLPLREEKLGLRDRTALVTGGASGIGFSIADEFLLEDAKRVLIADIDHDRGMYSAQKLCDKYGEGRCCYVPLNVSCTKQLKDVLCNVQKRFMSLDILVNNAAILCDDVDLEIDTNFRSILFATSIAYGVMKNQPTKGGVILNIGDVKGITACKFYPEYAAEKGGIHMFTIGSGRVSEGFHNVRVVGLAPGLTETEMGEKFKGKPVPASFTQCPVAVGKAAAYVVRFGPSSSLWVVNRNKLYLYNMPAMESMLLMETHV